MKHLLRLVCLISLMLGHSLTAADAPKSLAPVKLAMSTDLVKDFPIETTATTTEEEMKFTFGPKADGQYCTLNAQIARREDGSAKITVTFIEETKVAQSDGTQFVRNVGFTNLSTILLPGQEETLFTSGDKKFVVRYIKAKKA